MDTLDGPRGPVTFTLTRVSTPEAIGLVVKECRVPVCSPARSSNVTVAPSDVMTVIVAGSALPELSGAGSGSGVGSAIGATDGCAGMYRYGNGVVLGTTGMPITGTPTTARGGIAVPVAEGAVAHTAVGQSAVAERTVPETVTERTVQPGPVARPDTDTDADSAAVAGIAGVIRGNACAADVDAWGRTGGRDLSRERDSRDNSEANRMCEGHDRTSRAGNPCEERPAARPGGVCILPPDPHPLRTSVRNDVPGAIGPPQ